MSYLERTLVWFLKRRVLGGIQKLCKKNYLPFTIIVIFFMSINSVLSVLYTLNFFVTLELIQFMLFLELFCSLAIVISGVFVGKIKNLAIYYLIASAIIALFIFAFFYFDWEYNHIFFRYTKLSYFLIWVLISSISLFFLTIYFFTSFSKRVITLGMPKDHIFFGFIIKIVILISMIFYVYIILQMDLISIIFGVFGLINCLIVFVLVKRAPKKVESKPGIANFATAVGFFNMAMIYHLYMSISLTSESLVSLVFEIVLLSVGVLFLVQKLTQRITETPLPLKSFENPVQFQSRLYFTAKIKKVFGERGIIIIVLGIALGYHMVYLDSFFINDLPILSNIAPGLKMSDTYHMFYLFSSFIIIIIACIVFKSSKRFRDFNVNKFTIAQVLKYIGGFFKKTEDGVSPFELGVQAFGKNIGDKLQDSFKKFGDKLQDSFKKLGKDDLKE